MSTEERAVEWIRRNMPLTRTACSRLPDLRGIRLACSIHIDDKMIPAFEGLRAKNCGLFITTCNVQTVRSSTVDALRDMGAIVEASSEMSDSEWISSVDHALAWNPTHLCEMGAMISSRVLSNHPSEQIKAGLEATGTGINAVSTTLPNYPVFNWDDVPIKERFHNRYMVGVVACNAFMYRTGISFHRKNVVVIGYGLVGEGVCNAVRANGGSVSIVEIDSVRALEGSYSGFPVVEKHEAMRSADMIITATGRPGVVTAEDFPRLKHGCFLINVGHSSDEIDMNSFRRLNHRQLIDFVEEFEERGKSVYVFASGSMANLTAGIGDSLNSFDITLAIMVSGIEFMVREASAWSPGVHDLPSQAWRWIADAAVAAD